MIQKYVLFNYPATKLRLVTLDYEDDYFRKMWQTKLLLQFYKKRNHDEKRYKSGMKWPYLVLNANQLISIAVDDTI